MWGKGKKTPAQAGQPQPNHHVIHGLFKNYLALLVVALHRHHERPDEAGPRRRHDGDRRRLPELFEGVVCDVGHQRVMSFPFCLRSLPPCVTLQRARNQVHNIPKPPSPQAPKPPKTHQRVARRELGEGSREGDAQQRRQQQEAVGREAEGTRRLRAGRWDGGEGEAVDLFLWVWFGLVGGWVCEWVGGMGDRPGAANQIHL